MAQPTETFDSYDAVGSREDLQDKIYMVSPEKTPVVSSIRRYDVTQRLHEWQRDTLATPNKDNAVIEGDDRSGSALTTVSAAKPRMRPPLTTLVTRLTAIIFSLRPSSGASFCDLA